MQNVRSGIMFFLLLGLIGQVSAQTLLPDFSVSDPEIANGVITGFTFRNKGAVFPKPSVQVWVYWVDGKGFRSGDQIVLSVAPNEARKVRFSPSQISSLIGNPPPDAEHLVVRVDFGNAIEESDETNNILEIPRPRPDFALAAPVFEGDAIKGFTLQNKGTRSAEKPATIRMFWIDTKGTAMEPNMSAVVEALALSTQHIRFSPLHPPLGARAFLVVADAATEIEESDEGNNLLRIEYPGQAATIEDLIEQEKSKVSQQQELKRNLWSSIKDFWRNIFSFFTRRPQVQERAQIQEDPLKRLKEPGANLSPSLQKLLGIKSPAPNILEGKEIQPIFEVTSPASGTQQEAELCARDPNNPPDLMMEAVGINPAVPAESDLISFTATVKNQGSGCAGAFVVQARIDAGNDGKWNTTLSGRSLAGLAPSASALRSWRSAWPAPKGIHTVEICADPGVLVAESNEENNCSSKTFEVR